MKLFGRKRASVTLVRAWCSPFGEEGPAGGMTGRGVHKTSSVMVTSHMLGAFRDQPQTRQEFLAAIDYRGSSMGSSFF